MNGQTGIKREKLATHSGDIIEAQISRLRELFPEVFVEGKIDFDKVEVTLGAAESGPGRVVGALGFNYRVITSAAYLL